MGDPIHLAQLRRGIAEWNAWRDKNPNIRPDIRGVDLRLKEDLEQANFERADLREANLGRTNLQRANLSGADLREANFEGADLREANFEGARLGWTILGNVDLSTAQRLDTIQHSGPSTIGIDTLYRSKGNI